MSDILTLLAFFSAIYWARRWSKSLFHLKVSGRIGERRVADILQQCQFEALHDVYIEQKDGRISQIDHIVKFPNSLAVLETKNYSGKIFGDADSRYWTQSFGRHYRNQIRNPLHQNYGHIQAVQDVCPDVHVWGAVISAGSAIFPHGTPSGAYTLGTWRKYLSEFRLRKRPDTGDRLHPSERWRPAEGLSGAKVVQIG